MQVLLKPEQMLADAVVCHPSSVSRMPTGITKVQVL